MPKVVVCRVCGKKFPNYASMRKHIETHTEEADDDFGIGDLDINAPSTSRSSSFGPGLRKDRRKFQKKQSSGVEAALTREKALSSALCVCPYCTTLIPGAEAGLLKHIKGQHGDYSLRRTLTSSSRHFSCVYCYASFTRKYSRDQHIKMRHFGLKRRVKCPLCRDNFFNSDHELDDHIDELHRGGQIGGGNRALPGIGDEEDKTEDGIDFEEFENAVSGTASTYGVAFKENEVQDLETLRTRYMRLGMRRLLGQAMLYRTCLRVGLVVTGIFACQENGHESQPVAMVVRARSFILTPERIPHLDGLIMNSLDQVSARAESIAAQRSGFSLIYVRALSFELRSAGHLAKIVHKS